MTDDRIRALADKYLKHQIEGPDASGVIEFTRAVLAENTRKAEEADLRLHESIMNGIYSGEYGNS